MNVNVKRTFYEVARIGHFTYVTFIWRVKRACKSCAAINLVSLWPVRFASKTRNWDSELCFVRTYVYLRLDPMHASKSVIVASESLAFSLLKDSMSPSIPRPARIYNDAFYSRKISCTLTSLHLSVSHIGQDTVLQVSWVRGLCVLLHLWSDSCNDEVLILV